MNERIKLKCENENLKNKNECLTMKLAMLARRNHVKLCAFLYRYLHVQHACPSDPISMGVHKSQIVRICVNCTAVNYFSIYLTAISMFYT